MLAAIGSGEVAGMAGQANSCTQVAMSSELRRLRLLPDRLVSCHKQPARHKHERQPGVGEGWASSQQKDTYAAPKLRS